MQEGECADDLDDGDSELILIISAQGQQSHTIHRPKVVNWMDHVKRLEPIARLEEKLIDLLSSKKSKKQPYVGVDRSGHRAGCFLDIGSETPPSCGTDSTAPPSNKISSEGFRARQEFALHTTADWRRSLSLKKASLRPISAHSGEMTGWWEDPSDPVHMLRACAPAMIELWEDIEVRKVLRERNIRLQDGSGL